MRSLLLSIAITLTAAGCGSSSAPPSTPPPPPPADGDGDGTGAEKACVKGGCSGTACIEEGNDLMTTCEWKDEYACYQTATCERQPSGECGWTETAELTACLASPPPPAP